MLQSVDAVEPVVTDHALVARPLHRARGCTRRAGDVKTSVSLGWMLAVELLEFRQNSAVVPLSTNCPVRRREWGCVTTAPEMPLRPLVGIVMHDRELPPVRSLAENCCVIVLFCRTLTLSGVRVQVVEGVVLNATLRRRGQRRRRSR